MKNFIVAAIMAGICLSGCGEVAEMVSGVTNECPMTLEEDIYTPVHLLEDEVESMVYEWDSNADTYTEIGWMADDIVEIRVWENDCNTHTYYYYGT